jgi:superfamily II DNA or RNA helicase
MSKLSEEEIRKYMVLTKLLSYQVAHTLQLIECLRLKNRVLDASDTGTGKTYTSIAVASILNLKPFIICPKSVISNWIKVLNEFSCPYIGISNYEALKNNFYYDGFKSNGELDPIYCPFMSIDLEVINKDEKDPNKIKYSKKFKFQFPVNTIIIFDEAHRCKNYGSQTSNLLLAIIQNNIKIMLLSATITDKINCFKPFGCVFNFYNKPENFRVWITKHRGYEKERYKNWEIDKVKLDIIHRNVFPKFGSRLKIAELGNLFPQNNIIADSYYLENHLEVEKIYKEINQEIMDIKSLEDKSERLAKILRARMRIEMLKVPIYMDLAQEGLDSKYSVVIFVNFTATLEYLCYHLKTSCIIQGGQTIEERQKNIDDFQANRSKIIIVMIQAGGVGVSLHDLHGNHPRMSIISPTWSGQDLKQVLGRIHRAGSKTPAIQKIVFVKDTEEENICKLIKKKLTNIQAINDGIIDDVEIQLEHYKLQDEVKIKVDEKEEKINEKEEKINDKEEKIKKVKFKKPTKIKGDKDKL